MSREVAGLLGANVLVLLVGVGVLALLGAFASARELAPRLGLAYLAGLAVVGIAAASLALVRIPVGWGVIAVLAAAALAAGLPRLRQGAATSAPGRRSARDVGIALAGTVALSALLVRAWPAFAAAPLAHWDAWAIWTTKARALHELGWADPVVFANEAYHHTHLAYPLLVPALEALQFRAMGGFDAQAIHLQFLLFGVGLVGGVGGVLHDRVAAWLLWPALVSIAAAPAVLGQLLTAYADLPLAAFFAVGAAASGRWLVHGERWALAVASLLFAAALLTKYEAALFVAAVFLGLAGALALEARLRASLRALAAAALAAAAPLACWRVYVAAHDLGTGHAGAGELTFHPGVVPIALRRLLSEMLDPTGWALLLPITLVVLAAAALGAATRPLALYVLVLGAVPVAALTVNYAVSPLPHGDYLTSSAYRVVASLVLAGAALTPLLATEIATPRPRPGPAGPPGGTGR